MKNKMLKMKDLSRATGVSSGTIRYYVQEGILPRPIKTHRNMAYYDQSYVERIRAIKELQTKRYLPLNIIKMLLESKDFSLSGEQKRLVKDMDKPFFEDQALPDSPPCNPMTREELASHLGIQPKDVQGLESIGIIQADGDGRFDRESILIAETTAELRGSGLTEELEFQVEDLRIHADLIEFMARKEIELFTKRVAQKGLPADRVSTIAQGAVAILNKMIPILHRRMIRRILKELA
ncbi:MAG: MerR family transcriptional regulator [bacterium]